MSDFIHKGRLVQRMINSHDFFTKKMFYKKIFYICHHKKLPANHFKTYVYHPFCA
jgi:hypothetical protein